MSDYTPRRWADGPEKQGDPEADAGRLLREARSLTGPSAVRLAHIRQRVEARVGEPGVGGFLGRRLSRKALVSVLVGAAALASVGTAVGVAVVRGAREERTVPPPVVVPAPAPPEAPAPEEPAVSPVAPAPEEPVDEPGAAGGAVEGPPGERATGLEPEPENRPPRHRRHSAPKVTRPPPAVEGPPAGAGLLEPARNSLADETAMLSQALKQLQRSPAEALQTLDEYQRRYSGGALADEALSARLQALTALGRNEEALVVVGRLEARQLPPMRRSELRVVRGELLARSRRCEEAIAIFDPLVAQGTAGALGERALFGRSQCRLKLGDTAGARLDAEAYLARFPSGRFAAQARELLGR